MTATTVQRTHEPWCTEHDGFDDGSADWCNHLVQIGEVELQLVADGGPPSETHIELTQRRLASISLTLDEARRVHEAVGQLLAKAALSV